MKSLFKRGVTLLELMVVVVIIAILSTIAVGIYTKEILRAKYARTRAEIRTLEIAIAQYEVDTGQLPALRLGRPLDQTNPTTGCAYLTMSLRTSLSNQLATTVSRRWLGPYIDWDYNKIGDANGTPITDTNNLSTNNAAELHFLDSFGSPFLYIRASDYRDLGGTALPATNPFASAETYLSTGRPDHLLGADRTSSAAPNRGLDAVDITNFRSLE